MKKKIVYYICILLVDLALMILSVVSLSFSAIIGAFLALTISAITFVFAFYKEKKVGRIGNQILYLARIIIFPIVFYAVPMKIVNATFIYASSVLFLISSLMLLIPIFMVKKEEDNSNKLRIIDIILFAISSVVSAGFIIGSLIYTFKVSFDWQTSLLPIIILVGVFLSLLVYFLSNKRDIYLGVLLTSFLFGQAILFINLLLNKPNEVFMCFFQYDYLIIAMPFIWLALLLLPSLKKKKNIDNN